MNSDGSFKTLGTTWFMGKGAKDKMRQRSISAGAECEVQLVNNYDGYRQFGCYPTWHDAMRCLAPLQSHTRHLFEIITHGKPCKPYLDLDGDALPPGCADVQQVVDRAQALVASVFRDDYGVPSPHQN